jgi:phosphatidylglycerol---prolipoprotein diacylglyceryl transferase
MHQVLFKWHRITVFSYPAMLYLGIVLGLVTENYAAHLAGLNASSVFIATLVLLVPALIGARLLFVASRWELYSREPRRIWRRSEGGAALYGGLPCAVLVSLPLLLLLRLPFGAFWDAASLTILVGMLFARLGCLLHGCCAGRPAQGWFALYLPNQDGVWRRRLPTQILEMGWTALLFLAIAFLWWHHRFFPGALFLFLVGGYGLGRLLLEGTREEQDSIRGIILHRTISLALIAIALVCWFVLLIR